MIDPLVQVLSTIGDCRPNRSWAATKSSGGVDGVDQHPQPPQRSLVEVENQAGEMSQVRFTTFLGQCISLCVFAVNQNVAKLNLNLIDSRLRKLRLQTKHQPIIDVSHAVVDTIKIQRFFDRLVDRIRNLVKVDVFRTDCPAVTQLFVNELTKSLQ